MSYKSFEFSLKTDYVFTENAAQALKGQLERYKPAKPFVITSDARFQVVAQVKQMLEELGLPYVLRTDCMSNPTSDFVNDCAAQAAAEGCDFLIGIGGGSVIDASKTTALLIANPTEGGIWDYVSFAKEPANPALPIGLIVTIPSTGSESNPSAVISNVALGMKQTYTQDSLRPTFSITSPELTYTLPTYPAACGITDILSHLLEQYLHNDTHVDVSDGMVLGVMKGVVKWGPKALEQPDCYDAKANLLWASYLAMSRVLGLGHDENWICHDVEHSISAKFNLAHGAGMAIVMPAYVDMITPTDVSGRLARLSAEVFEQPDRPAGELLREFFTGLGMPTTLAQANIVLSEQDIQECAAKSLPWGTIQLAGYEPFDTDSVCRLLRQIG